MSQKSNDLLELPWTQRCIISNYWMRLSMIRRIMQIEDSEKNEIKVTVHHIIEKWQNYAFYLCCVGGKTCQIFLLYAFKTIRLLKRSWFILERSQSFSLREVEKDLSLTALVAGFMKISLHNMITFYHFPFWVG